ncbi:MAG: hypothetical protein V2A66_02490 [Pseudomonadota bacterium]
MNGADLAGAESRAAFWHLSNIKAILENKAKGVNPDDTELMIFGRGLAYLNDPVKKMIVQKYGADLEKVAGAERGVAKVPYPARVFMEGGNVLSTYGTVFNAILPPLEPVASDRGSYEFLKQGDDQHLIAEWLVCYSKLRARTLLAEGRIGAEDYIYFIKNIPFATKMLLENFAGWEVTPYDIVERIKKLTPEYLFRMIESSGFAPQKLNDLKKEKDRIRERVLKLVEIG